MITDTLNVFLRKVKWLVYASASASGVIERLTAPEFNRVCSSLFNLIHLPVSSPTDGAPSPVTHTDPQSTVSTNPLTCTHDPDTTPSVTDINCRGNWIWTPEGVLKAYPDEEIIDERYKNYTFPTYKGVRKELETLGCFKPSSCSSSGSDSTPVVGSSEGENVQ